MATGWIQTGEDPRLGELWPLGADYGAIVDLPLAIARIQCERFAPALAEDADVPDNYIGAQVMQARALVRAGITGSNDQLGGYGDTVTVFPMDWAVKNMLRPRRGKPYFGQRRAS